VRVVLSKVLFAIGTLLFVLVFNFFLFRVLPANPAKNLTRSNALTAAQLAEVNKTFGEKWKQQTGQTVEISHVQPRSQPCVSCARHPPGAAPPQMSAPIFYAAWRADRLRRPVPQS